MNKNNLPQNSLSFSNVNRQKMQNIFVNMNIWKAILRMAIPGMIIAFMTGLYLFIDQILIVKIIPNDGVNNIDNKFIEANKIFEAKKLAYPDSVSDILGFQSGLSTASIVRRAINYSGSITGIFAAISLLFSMGTATRYSFYLGKGQLDKAKAVFKTGLLLSVIISLLTSLLIFFVKEPWINFQIEGASENGKHDWFVSMNAAEQLVIKDALQLASSQSTKWSADFVNVLVWFIVTQSVFSTIQFTLRSEGKTAIPMWIAIGTNLLNVLLEWVFLSELKLGISGGAWATVVGWCVSLSGILIYVTVLTIKKKTLLEFNIFKDFRLDARVIGAILTIGAASFIRNAAASFNGTLQNNAFSYVAGVETGAYLSAFGSIVPVWMLMFPVFLGIVQGARSVSSYNYGAANYKRVKESYVVTITLGFIFGLFVYLVIGVGLMRYFVQIFDVTPSSPQYNIALDMTYRWFVSAPFFGVMMGGILLYQSTERPLISILVSALSGVVIYIPIMFIFKHNSNGDIWIFIWTSPTTMMISSLMTIIMSTYTLKYSLGKSKKDLKHTSEVMMAKAIQK